MIDVITGSIFGAYISLTIIFVIIKFLAISKRAEKGGRSKFFVSLDKKFDLGLIEDQNDIEILKGAIEREAGTVYSLAHLLEDYLVYLGDRGSKESQLSPRYQKIKGIIASENADKPFADIPEDERRLLISMRDAIQHNDTEAITFNLNELSSVISARNRDYEGVLNANRWMRPLAIIGLVASVIFGVFALVK
jgi:hypothetical protein